MNALDLVEERVVRLERLLGMNEIPTEINDTKDVNDSVSIEPVTDTLINAGALLTSAVNGRDKINNVIQRSTELDTYLDPNYIDKHQSIDSRKSYINTVAPEIVHNADLLKELERLAPNLDSSALRDIPDISDKLIALRTDLSDQKQNWEFVDESIILAMQRYNEIHATITTALRSMTQRIDDIEAKLKPVKKQLS